MDDLISRQAAINEVKRFAGYLDDDMIYRIVLALERLPDAVKGTVRQPTAKDLITCKHSVSAVLTSGSISCLGNVCIADFEDWGLMFFDEKEITVIAKKEIKSLVIRPSTEQEDEMLNIPKPEHVPEVPPRFKVGQYIIYRNGERYELGRVKEITKDGAFVSYTEGNGGSLTLFSDMHPLINDYCIKETTLGGDFFGNSEK